MARKRRVSKKKKTLKLKDERWRKFFGLFCWLVAIYLAIAFVSYLFTWKVDQDKVLKFSWMVLFQGDLGVSNWLGRLGAVTSNAFFYWGYGLPSVTTVFLLLRLGYDLIKRRRLGPFWLLTGNVVLISLFFSLCLEFAFSNSEFTWGGAFGESSYLWLSNFLGNMGLLVMIIFITTAYIIWNFNPSFSFAGINIPFRIHNPLEKMTQKWAKNIKEAKAVPSQKLAQEGDQAEDYLRPGLSSSSKEIESEVVAETDLSDGTSRNFGNGLEFESVQDSSPRPNLTLDSELEITAANGEGLTTSSAIGQLTDDSQSIPGKPNTRDPYNPKLDLSNYKMPVLDFLNDYNEHKTEIDRAELEANKDQIIETLSNYNIKITKIRATIGPTVTLYEIVPAPGVKISKIRNLEDDIALSLAALGIRIIAPIPGKGTIGIEVPNKKSQIVSLKEVLNSEKYRNTKMQLPIALGKTIANEVFVADLSKMPHLLIAGATGQGKSVGINTILMSLLYKKHPSELKLVLVDPKRVELPIYNDISKHYLAKLPGEDEAIITDTTKVIHTLNSLCIEMDNRYELLQKARVRNIKEYNKKFQDRKLNPLEGHKFLPFIVLVIDEFADLIMTAGKEVEMPIGRLAQLARAVGIHLIIATQRPSVKIITGLIKANFPARLAFKVTSTVDSRTILDSKGADQLIGRGDMLLSIGGNNVRLQCAFIDTPEVEEVITHIAGQQGYETPYMLPEFVGENEDGNGKAISYSDLDPMFDEAAKLIVGSQSGSTSMIQRKLSLGYNRAGRIMDQMESLGIVGAAQGSKPREVLFFSEQELDAFMDKLKN
ncbi:FtsK/SpoIIIE family DNA translocase [Portibacter marinus]|uniref:FtsK/SpoIIIE family DNA translocase n=1 Tax=Portibacter marinus TaxID=2898660 RepID=UPI001F4129C7|nr:DNA translocase FtsK [Portibacter marinus]